MTVEEMAKIIHAEASVLPRSGKLGVAQCIIDNNYNASAFTTPSKEPDAECLEVARSAMRGERRFPNYRVLQFRSFAKYADANGNPDPDKLYNSVSNLPRNYLYLGKDQTEDGKWGTFYFGLPKVIPQYKLQCKILYKGSDGMNLRSTPEIKPNNIVGVVKGGTYTVQKYSDNRDFVLLKSGVWISANPMYVRIFEGNIVNYMIRVTDDDVNIRRGHGGNYVNFNVLVKGAYTIIEECEGTGSNTAWGLLKSYERERNGWVNLDEVERI